MSLTWKIAILAAVLWGLGWAWYLVTISSRSDRDEDRRAVDDVNIVAWSEERVLKVVDQYPNSAAPALVYAGHALARKDFDEAARRFQLAIDRNRREIKGYLGAERALREAGRLDEAEAVLRLAQRRFPLDRYVLADLAWTAHRRPDWLEAARRWETFRKHFPMVKSGYIYGADALRMLGRAADADALAAEAAVRFPEPAAETIAGG